MTGSGSGTNGCGRASPSRTCAGWSAYLQREIREGRRNVGALKLSNLLQPDRFEEDLNIRRVRLEPLPRPPTPAPPPLSEPERERRRLHELEQIRQLKESLR